MTNPTPRGDAAETLRPEPRPDSEHLSPGDVLSDAPEESVDIQLVRTRTHAGLTPTECADIRAYLTTEGGTVDAAAAAIDRSDTAHSTLARHYRGRCGHTHDTPPVAYDPQTRTWHTDTEGNAHE